VQYQVASGDEEFINRMSLETLPKVLTQG